MTSRKVRIIYKESLNWTERKIQRHLLARGDSDSELMLGMTLALINHRLPFYGKCTAALEDPVALVDLAVNLSDECAEEVKEEAVVILCEIANHYIDLKMELDYLHIQLLIHNAAKICMQFECKNLVLVSAVKSMERLMKRQLNLDDIEKLSNQQKLSKSS